MDLNQYIQGIRKGRDINCLEREAMEDALLAEALEGYDLVKGEHLERIEEMVRQVVQQTHSKSNKFGYGVVAVILLVAAAVGLYFLYGEDSFSISDYFPKEKTEIITPKTSAELEKRPEEHILSTEPDSLPEKQDSSLLKPLFTYQLSDSAFIWTPIGNEPIVQDTVPEKEPEEKNVPKEEGPKAPKPAVGYSAYNSYLKNNLIRPMEDDCNEITGKVILAFSVDGNGRPYDIYVLKSLCPGANEEAIRLLKEGPGWISGEKEGRMEVRF